MADSVQTVDIVKIIEEIRQEIRDKGYKNEDIPFSDIPLSGVQIPVTNTENYFHNLRLLRDLHDVRATKPLESKRLFGPIIIFFKKIIRRCIAFYVEPIVVEQNLVNRLSVSCIIELSVLVETLRKRIELLEKRNERPGP